MRKRLKNWIAWSLILQIILIRVLRYFPQVVEDYYSLLFYPYISRFFRFILGWIPFSVGDLIYGTLIFLAIRYLILEWGTIRRKPLGFARDLMFVLAVIHFTFYASWGLNYYRIPLSKTLDIEESYAMEQLLETTDKLLQKTNSLQEQLTGKDTMAVEFPQSKKDIFEFTKIGYKALEEQFPEFRYPYPSIKNSLFSTGLSYMGYGGYLNPFTHEAQVNAKIPKFRFPVVAGHEIGHQIGYSAENEVNFIGYLVTSRNADLHFQYSAAAYALGYCLSEIRRVDEARFREMYGRLNIPTRKNYEELNRFWTSYQNPLEPVFKSIFNSFLKANNQPKGIQSYNMVVSLIVNYHQKHPL